MKKKFLIASCLFFIIGILFASCKSVPRDLSESLYVMIYDYENNALKDVCVYEDGVEQGYSDIYGRYVLLKLKKGETELEFYKAGYEKVSITVNKKDGQVLYVKLGSGSYYARLSEKALDEKKLEAAEYYIEKALECESRKDYEYLKKVIQKEIENEKI